MKTIIKVKRGDSFKGHSLIFQEADDPIEGRTIIYSNQYFGSTSTQQYIFKKDITKLRFCLFQPNTKWMKEKHKQISDLYIPSCSFQRPVFSLQEDIQVYAGQDEYGFKRMIDLKIDFLFLEEYIIPDFTGEIKGFNFLSHKENINCIEDLRKILSIVKKNYKALPISEFENLPNVVEYEHLSTSSPKWMLPNSLLE